MRLKNIYPKPEKPTNNDDRYLAWIRTKVSCVSGRYSEYVMGEGRCIAAHVRRSSNSGIGIKPLFSAVPLTDSEHRITHQHGEQALLDKLGIKEDAKAFFDKQVVKYRKMWENHINACV